MRGAHSVAQRSEAQRRVAQRKHALMHFTHTAQPLSTRGATPSPRTSCRSSVVWSAVRGLSWSFSPRPSRARRDARPPARSRRSWSSGSTKSYCWQGCWQIHPTPSGPSNSSGRNVVWNFTKMSSSVCSGRSAMLAHNGIISSSLSLMAQGFGVTISAESGILARLVSMTMLAFLTTSW